MQVDFRQSVGAVVRGLVALLAISVAGVGCSGGDGGDGADTDSGGMADTDGGASSVAITKLQAVPNPSNALSYYVDWSTSKPVPTELAVACGEDWRQEYTADEPRTDHRVFVMGLWDGASCELTATARAEGGQESTEKTAIEVGPLAEHLPQLEVKERKASKIQDGWTMFNLSNSFDNVPLTVAMIDQQGRYRWYHQLSVNFTGSDTEVHPMEDSILVGKTRNGPREINWEGDVIWKSDFRTHHEVRPSENGEWLYFLKNQGGCEQDAWSGGVFRYSRADKKVLDKWLLCDYWFPAPGSDLNDWSHLNTIEKVPGKEVWILSSRTQHTLFAVDYGNDELAWKMGQHDDFGLEDDERFYRQHAPMVLENGNILLFDNGSANEGRPWSRALEIEYDTDTMEASAVWEYRPDPDVYAPIWGDADRLANGNTLVTFGLRDDDPASAKNSHLMEVTDAKERVWHVEAPNKWGWYRSDRITDLPVGFVKEE